MIRNIATVLLAAAMVVCMSLLTFDYPLLSWLGVFAAWFGSIHPAGWELIMASPTKPEGVRLVLRDGTEVPVDVEYVGIGLTEGHDGNWTHVYVWEVLTEVPVTEGMGIKADMIPAHTRLRVPYSD